MKIKTVQKLATLDITIVYDNTAFSSANIDYILNTDAPVTVLNDDNSFTFSIPTTFPSVPYTIYLTDGTVTSETKTFLT